MRLYTATGSERVCFASCKAGFPLGELNRLFKMARYSTDLAKKAKT